MTTWKLQVVGAEKCSSCDDSDKASFVQIALFVVLQYPTLPTQTFAVPFRFVALA